MINRLLLIRSIGQFDSVASAAAIQWTPVTLVYAENGRGKTTLAAILRSLSSGDPIPILERRRLAATSPPQVVVDCTGGPPPAIFKNGAWNRTGPNLIVFDDTFVDQNVSSGLVVGAEHRQNLHEWILGSQGVALNATLQDYVERIAELNRKLRAKADAIPVGVRGLTADDFCALQPRQDIDAAIQEAERALAAAEQEETIRNARPFEPLSLPEFEVEEIGRTLARGLPELEAAAAAQVQAHLAPMGDEGEAWVGSGMQWVVPGERERCPFCAQDIQGLPLIDHYRSYFSAAYGQLKQHIADVTAGFLQVHGSGVAPAIFERNVRLAVERRQYWSQFTDIPEIYVDAGAIGEAWARARDAVFTALQRKQNAPLERMALSAADMESISAYERERDAVRALNDSLRRTNNSIALVKERAAASNRAALSYDLELLRAAKRRHTPDIDALCADYLGDKEAKVAMERARADARSALDVYRQRVFPNYETAINLYLQRFNAGFRLARVTSVNTSTGSSCTYNVLINNEQIAIGGSQVPAGDPSFRNALSAGDRSTLALAFFFASLDQDPALADKIVVLDDPITSLDEHRSLATVQETRRLSERAQQVIALSHDKAFLANIWEETDTDQRAALEVVRDGDGSTIRKWDVNRDLITEHDRRHALLREYLNAPGRNGREVAQSLRPQLESFLRVAYPEHFPPGTMLGGFLNLCEQRVGSTQEILNQGAIAELRDLKEYGNRFHHDTNPAWLTAQINDSELLGFVRRTLAFTRR